MRVVVTKSVVCFLFYRVTTAAALELGHILASSCQEPTACGKTHCAASPSPPDGCIRMNVNTTDATTGATADATVGNGYCPLRIHTPYINYMTPYLTPYETRSMRVVVTKSVETSGGGHLGHVFRGQEEE
jgi:hypothetical protein